MRADGWGTTMARYRWLLIGAWVAVLLAAAAAYPVLQDRLTAPDYGVDGAESTRARDIVQREFAALGAEQDVIVFSADGVTVDDPAYRATIEAVLAAVRAQPGAIMVTSPAGPAASLQVSADRTAALATIGLEGTAAQRIDRAAQIQDEVAAAATRAPGEVHAWLTGYSPLAHDLAVVQQADVAKAESVGVPVALTVLLLALGTVVAALVPLALAGAGLLATYGVITVLSGWIGFTQFVIVFITMIGLGVGIDYAMFVVSRFREELRRGGGPRADRTAVADAVGAAMATSGRTIAASGAIVVVSLCSLFVVQAPIFREIAWGSAVVVTVTVVAAWTLLPAALAALGPRVERGSLPRRWQPADARSDADAVRGGWARWAAAVMRRPVLAAGITSVALLAATAPVFGMSYGLDLGVRALDERPTGHAQQVLVEQFSPGAVSPIQVVVADGARDPAGVAELTRRLSADERVTRVDTVPDSDGPAVVLSVVASVPVDSPQALDLVRDLRSPDGPSPDVTVPEGLSVLVGGATAQYVDLSAETRWALPVVLALVLGISLVFLLAVFRSVLLPVKAVLMNLLGTGAALGLLVLVFQYGVGASLIGYTSTGFIQVYLPLTVFALLFGLSTDYEVFLISRMRESWDLTGDNTAAVAAGVQHTARPISAAAAIMVAVFGSFMLSDSPAVQQIGFALAVAIALDATLVRLVLVPALMRLFGQWNWWLPGRAQPVHPQRAGQREVGILSGDRGSAGSGR